MFYSKIVGSHDRMVPLVSETAWFLRFDSDSQILCPYSGIHSNIPLYSSWGYRVKKGSGRI